MIGRPVSAVLLALTATVSCGDKLDSADYSRPLVGVDAQAVRPAELRAAAEDRDVRRIYEARQWQLAWPEEQRRALAAVLSQADRHALDRWRFLEDIPEAATRAQRDAAFSRAALKYAAEWCGRSSWALEDLHRATESRRGRASPPFHRQCARPGVSHRGDRALLELWNNRGRSSAAVKALATARAGD